MDESNKKAHHTDMYNSSELILRRGQSCRLTLEFNKPLTDWQSILFIASTGPQNSGYQNTNVQFPLSNSWSSGMWSAVLESNPGSSLKIIMSSPANAVIGRYDLSVQITVMGQSATYSLGKFILLFNPWCLDDDVYMANEEERREYVLNDHGVIFMGNEKHVNGIGWNFGQFENNIINVCLDILDRSLNCQKDAAADYSRRNSPIYVGRVISAMINSNDDFGVLEGKWEKDFSDGVDPNSWNGSVEILLKWKNDSFKPVKYGQCWVFAAVMCSVLRCLGIPTRVITNFNSAHNTDGNMCIDMHYDTEGKFLELSDDSIWNFHVWNESWFLRRDLGLNYSGWQVLDSTPQETSQGIHRCGPTSVIAVKEGDIHLGYDTPFVFAEVNADRVTWVVQKDGSKEKAHSDSKYVGQSISTKAVGSDDRVDVTLNYKYPEGSPQERQVFEKASRNMPHYSPPVENSNVNRNNNNMVNRPRSDSPMRAATSTPNLPALTNGRPSSPAPSRSSQPPSGTGYRPGSPSLAPRVRSSSPAPFSGSPSPNQPSSANSVASSSGRPSSSAPFSGRSSPALPSGNDYWPETSANSVASSAGRPSSPSPFSGRPSSAHPSGNGYWPGSSADSMVSTPSERPSSPAPFSSRSSVAQPSGNGYRPASPANSLASARGRPSSPSPFSGRPSSAHPSGDGYWPETSASSMASTPSERSSSSAPFSSRLSSSQPSGNGYRPGSSASPSGRPSSPAPFSGRPSSERPSSPAPFSGRPSNERPLSPASFSGRPSSERPLSPAPFSGRPSRERPLSPATFSSRSSNALYSGDDYRSPSPVPSTPRPNSSEFEGPDIAGKFKLLSPLVVGDDINLLLVLKNLTPYHRPVKVNLSASCVLYTGRRLTDIFTDQKSLIISPNQDAHISLQIPYTHYYKCMEDGNMVQVVALCELPFGEKVVITKDLVLEYPPIIIKPLSNPVLHTTMTLEIRFTNPLNIAVTDCVLVVEGSGLIDRQLSAVVPYLKPKEKIKFKVELTPYRTGTRQLIANFKCNHFSIKGYHLLNVEGW